MVVDEFKCAVSAAGGNRKPSEAGIRMGNEKYMFVRHDAEAMLTQMSRAGGGATICKLKKGGIVIGIYNKDDLMSNGGNQNPGDCAFQVEMVAEFLRGEGY